MSQQREGPIKDFWREELRRERDEARQEIDRLRKRIEKAYRLGWEDGVRLYAIWDSGQQLVGVMRRPLSEVLRRGPDSDIMAAHITLGGTSV